MFWQAFIHSSFLDCCLSCRAWAFGSSYWCWRTPASHWSPSFLWMCCGHAYRISKDGSDWRRFEDQLPETIWKPRVGFFWTRECPEYPLNQMEHKALIWFPFVLNNIARGCEGLEIFEIPWLTCMYAGPCFCFLLKVVVVINMFYHITVLYTIYCCIAAILLFY